MKNFLKDIKHFVTDLKFIIPLVLTVALGYGYVVGHFAIGIDDLTRPRYLGGELAAQGRLSGIIISYIFGFTEYRPVWEDLVSILFIIIAGIMAAVFLKRVTKNMLNPYAYTFFACFFASYPLINEIFLYSGSGLNMGIGYSLTFIALILMEDFFERKKWYTILFCALILAFNISMYESFVFVYSCAVCGVLLIKQLSADKDSIDESSFKVKNTLLKIVWYIVPLIVGFIAEYIVTFAIRTVFDLSADAASAAGIVFPPNIRDVFTFSVYRFVFNGLWYLPITVLVISGVVLTVITIRSCVKFKRPIYFLYFAGMILSVLALPILQSGEIKYRTSQALVIFCAFPLVLLLQQCMSSGKKVIRYTAVAVSLLLVFAQSASLCKWFAVDYKQSEAEKAVLCSVGDTLAEEYDVNKPVVFVGEYTLPDEVLDYKFAGKDDLRYKLLDSMFGNVAQSMSAGVPSEEYGFAIAQTKHMSVITWGVDAFGEVNTELLRILSYHGYDFIQGSPEQFEEGCEIAEQMASKGEIPESGYAIAEQETYTLVVFG